jgi:hypothetical protein
MTFQPGFKSDVSAVGIFAGTASDPADLTTYTFADVSFGGEIQPSDAVIIEVGARNASDTNRTIVSATIAGQAAAVLHSATSSGSMMFFIGARLPAGTTSGDVVVQFSGGVNRAAIFVHRAKSLLSLTPVATAVYQNASNGNGSGSVAVPKGGFAIAAEIAATVTTMTWSGDLSLDTTILIESTVGMSSASANFTAAKTASASVAAPGANSRTAFAMASFR